MVAHAKPDPDLFLAAAALLGVEAQAAFVVGDSVWDLLAARRARAIGIGVLSGGYGREELERAGAYRVYADPADLLARADEVGVRLGPPRPAQDWPGRRLPRYSWPTGWLVASAAPTWSASATASSRCSWVGRAPGPGVIRNRP